MAKNKKSEIPHYELLYIVSNKFTEEELKPILKNVNKLITDNEGKSTKLEEWGKKKFMYPIKHFNYGYYTLIEFDMPGKNLEKVEKELRLSREVLRHQIVSKRLISEEEIKTKKEKIQKRTVTVAEQGKKKLELEKEKTRGKVNLKDLDDKLDKILETDDLL